MLKVYNHSLQLPTMSYTCITANAAVEPLSVSSNHPPRIQIRRDNSVSLGVEGKGEDLVYQWFKDGLPISKALDLYLGVNTSTLSISKASLQHEGEYHCVVSNEEGQVNSQRHELCVCKCI